MNRLFFLLTFLIIYCAVSHSSSQSADPPQETATLFVGDPAPKIEVESWLKGMPVTDLRNDVIYVVHFWSTNCGACIETHAEMAKLVKDYDGRVQPITIDVYEANTPADYTNDTRIRVEKFVEKHHDEMPYSVGYDGPPQRMQKSWLEASDQRGIPTTFILTKTGRVAFVGHALSDSFRSTLEAVVKGEFDLERASATYKERRVRQLIFNQGRALFVQGKLEESVRVFDDLKTRWPQLERSVEFEKFQNYVTAKRIDEAVATAEILVDRLLKDDSGLLGVVAEHLASICSRNDTRGLEVAIRAGLRAIETNEKNYPGPYHSLARVYWASGKIDLAVEMQRKAVDVAPDEYKKNFEPQLREYEAKLGK